MSGIILLSLRLLSALALYLFLGWSLFMLWQQLRQEASSIASRKITPIALHIQTPDQEDRLFQVSTTDVSIGRDPDCECVLTHATVSARHARLSYHHSQWWVDDLLSTNGTKLNDEPLQLPTVVVNGDTIKCGQISLTVVFEKPSTKETGDL